MKINMLLSASDNHFYLKTNSILKHRFHHPLSSETLTLNKRNITETEEDWIQEMYAKGLSDGTIASIMTGVFNKKGQSGEFTKEGIRYILKEHKELQDVLDGIHSNFSIAMKSIFSLNGYVHIMSSV